MSEKNLEEKIKKWEDDLKKLLVRRTDLEKKIEEIKDKISSAKKEMEAEKNKKIAEAVEQILGPLDEQKLDDLKLELMILAEEKSKKASEISDLDSGRDDYFEIDGEEEDTGE